MLPKLALELSFTNATSQPWLMAKKKQEPDNQLVSTPKSLLVWSKTTPSMTGNFLPLYEAFMPGPTFSKEQKYQSSSSQIMPTYVTI
jgi:hypothetical protein